MEVTPPPPSYSHGPYTYKPLEQGSIRVLVLLEADELQDELEGGFIHMSLTQASIDDNAYIALSYVWGDMTDPSVIYFDDKVLHVGKNLDTALRHLRRKDIPILMWVDAICIDQSNLKERNHQVQQMRDIYSSARETIVYIGDQTGNNTGLSAWNFVERQAEWALNEDQEKDYERPRELEDRIDFRGTLYDVCDDILAREWFNRAWVLQEVAVSRSVSIQCGTRRVPWDDLCKLIILTKRRHDQYGRSLSQEAMSYAVRIMFHLRVGFQLGPNGHGNKYLPPWYQQAILKPGPGMEILEILEAARSFNATDPRDKIIALLGISTGFDWISHGTVDYEMSQVAMYTKFARDHLESSSDYVLLGFREPNTSGEPGILNSWVPNWNISSTHRVLTFISPTNFRSCCRISAKLPQETEQEAEARKCLVRRWRTWVGKGSKLAVRGHIIGSVTAEYTTQLHGAEEGKFDELREAWEAKRKAIDSGRSKEPRKVEEADRKGEEEEINEEQMAPVESYILSLWAHYLDMGHRNSTTGAVEGGHNVLLLGNRSHVFDINTILSTPLGNWCAFSKEYHDQSKPPSYQGEPIDKPQPSGVFMNHINIKDMPKPNSIEHHLVKRARVTTASSEIRNQAAWVVVDKNSIIDNRRLGIYDPTPVGMGGQGGQEKEEEEEKQEKRVDIVDVVEEGSLKNQQSNPPPPPPFSTTSTPPAPRLDNDDGGIGGAALSSVQKAKIGGGKLILLPNSARPGDLIVYFPGARTPFVIRHLSTRDCIFDKGDNTTTGSHGIGGGSGEDMRLRRTADESRPQSAEFEAYMKLVGDRRGGGGEGGGEGKGGGADGGEEDEGGSLEHIWSYVFIGECLINDFEDVVRKIGNRFEHGFVIQ